MTPAEMLKKLLKEADEKEEKRAAKKARRAQLGFACAVCGKTPAPMTRLGPRCEKHELIEDL